MVAVIIDIVGGPGGGFGGPGGGFFSLSSRSGLPLLLLSLKPPPGPPTMSIIPTTTIIPTLRVYYLFYFLVGSSELSGVETTRL